MEGQRPSRTVVPRAVVRADREAYLYGGAFAAG